MSPAGTGDIDRERLIVMGSEAWGKLMLIPVEEDQNMDPGVIEIRKDGQVLERIRLVTDD